MASHKRRVIEARGFAQRVHGGLADAARRHVQHAQQRDIVLWVHRQTDVGQSVFYFGAIVEAEAAHQFVTNAAAAEDFFERARLKVGAVLDGAGLRGIVVKDAVQFSGDEFGFGVGVAPFEIFQVGAAAVFGAQRLTQRSGLLATTAPAASRMFCVER